MIDVLGFVESQGVMAVVVGVKVTSRAVSVRYVMLVLPSWTRGSRYPFHVIGESPGGWQTHGNGTSRLPGLFLPAADRLVQIL